MRSIANRASLIVVLLVTIILAVVMALLYVGWFLFGLWWAFVLLILFHLFTHIYFLWNINVFDKRILKRIFLSHFVFLLLFLLRPDISDARGQWITILLITGQLFKGIQESLLNFQENDLFGYGGYYCWFYLLYIAFFIFLEIRFIRFAKGLIY